MEAARQQRGTRITMQHLNEAKVGPNQGPCHIIYSFQSRLLSNKAMQQLNEAKVGSQINSDADSDI